jgi:hypothetical protein
MSLIPRLVAIQGIGFTPIEVAVQGLLAYYVAKKDEIIGGYAKHHVNYKAPNRAAEDEAARNYVDRLNEQHKRQLRIQQDDAQAVEFITALLQSEILHG